MVPSPTSERIALISDVHGNLTALEAVLADIDARGITRIFNLGDYVGKGHRGREVVEICQQRCEVNILGNWDDFLPHPAREFDNASLQWWLAQLAAGQGEWLRALPFSHDFTMSGRRIRIMHASSETVHRRVRYVHDEREFLGQFANTPATGNGPVPDVVGFGDSHDPFYETQLRGRTLFNTGSVGNCMGDPTPLYCILEGVVDSLEPAPFGLSFVRVPYDVEAELAHARESGAPEYAGYESELRRGVYRGAIEDYVDDASLDTYYHVPRPTVTIPDPALARALRAALVAADFTVDAVDDLLGATARAALQRNETTPALRRTTSASPLATLIRLFLLQAPVDRADTERALPGLVDELTADGLLAAGGTAVRAALDCRPYADDARDWWVVSDLTPGLDGLPIRVTADHVLGVSPASTSLAQLTIRKEVGRALDLGTGCGVQSLHLSAHSGVVTATDVNPRALAITTFNAALNEIEIDVRAGSLWEPVAEETFDLITANPPFVISPGGPDRLVYRDSGLPGDQVVEAIVRGAPGHLAEGGWCHVVANWAIPEGRPWDERLAEWLADDCDAFVVQREVLDPPAYVELWLKDAGRHGEPGYLEAYDAWLGWFEDQRIEGVGFGWVSLSKGGPATRGTHELLDHPYAVEQPVAAAVEAWSAAQRTEIGEGSRLSLRVDVVQETRGDPGAEDPETIVLRQRRGLCRVRKVDTVEAALAGASDGELTVRQILDALAVLLDRDRDELATAYLPVVRRLVREGFLTPA